MSTDAGIHRALLVVTPMVGLLTFTPLVALSAEAMPFNVTVTDKGCEPNSLTVPEGKSTFAIKNASRRALEWEILDGVTVVEERENIIPGFTQTLSAMLSPGEYQ
jgi:iron uptake system component EfeO